ncbi:hypothetical protein EJ08DRAFT_709171 [Tothia fuscella]|uniref:Uncharacterized protein n=1 Tax=Tothia fuscella TaxID=1048955 RepID=A0A9P4NXD1_9PEZI|nr:hypothetical protein EJ08DRAFT_709171 [Tothia fuscella]
MRERDEGEEGKKGEGVKGVEEVEDLEEEDGEYVEVDAADLEALLGEEAIADDIEVEDEDLETLVEEAIPDVIVPALTHGEQLEATARDARNSFGDTLPEGLLNEEEYAVYERSYGAPTRITTEGERLEVEDDSPEKTVLLREAQDGVLEEVEYDVHEEEEAIEPTQSPQKEEERKNDLMEQVNARNAQRNTIAEKPTPAEAEEEEEFEEPDEEPVIEEFPEDIWPGDEFIRTHPLTLEGRSGTNPSTLTLPSATFIDPISNIISGTSIKQLTDVAQRTLGGVGLPYSPSTPKRSRTMEQKPIGLSAGQSRMTEMEADVYMTCVMPQVYASVMGVLVETRKRLSRDWLRALMAKDGGPMVFDAGAGGAGVVAWRELCKVEWEGWFEDGDIPSHLLKDNEKGITIPHGKATVLTASDTLRHRSSKLLENTTFLPRLPDIVPKEQDPTQSQRKQYDIIIAPHTLWPIKEGWHRKSQVNTLWSLLNPKGGVLIIMEKGVPRGFEIVAGAREMLLKRHIASPNSTHYSTPLEEPSQSQPQDNTTPPPLQTTSPGGTPLTPKETACIIAPCTNHTSCPLYKVPGVSRQRKDWCYFSQRYTRPSFLQGILGAKSRNFDDVEYSYLAVRRGVDVRSKSGDGLMGLGAVQGEEATERAFGGFGPRWVYEDPSTTVPSHSATAETEEEQHPAPHPLSLPRTLLTPLKRKGHILIDVCTPSGTLERWMVSRSRPGKQAYRDARKAKWGDLWALGAKSRTERRVRLGRAGEDRTKDVKGKGRPVKSEGGGKGGEGSGDVGEGGGGGEGMRKKSQKGKWKYKGGKGGKGKGPVRDGDGDGD